MKKPTNRIAKNFGRQVRGQTFIELGREAGLSIQTRQEVWPQLTSHGSPFPIVAFSFDDLLANTAPNYYEAGIRFAREHFGKTCLVPSLEEFRRIHDFEEYSILYDLGIPRQIPFQNVWNPYLKILLAQEREHPTQLYPWIPEFLQDTARRFHPVIVTSNKTHAIAEIIRNQAGIEKFDVVIVPARNKSLVLGTLADHHHANHGSVRIPFNFFCSSLQDAALAQECGKWVRTFGVLHQNGHVNGNGNHYFEQSLERNGAIPITPDQMPAVVYGLHSLGYPKAFSLS